MEAAHRGADAHEDGVIGPEFPPSRPILPGADDRLRRFEQSGIVELRPERVCGRQQPPLPLSRLFDGRGEAIWLDDSLEERCPRAVADANGLGLDEPYRDAFGWLQLGQFIEILRHRAELISVLLRHDDQAPSPTSNRIRESAGEVIVIRAPVLILDDELGAVVG